MRKTLVFIGGPFAFLILLAVIIATPDPARVQHVEQATPVAEISDAEGNADAPSSIDSTGEEVGASIRALKKSAITPPPRAIPRTRRRTTTNGDDPTA